MNSAHVRAARPAGWRRWLPPILRYVVALIVVLAVGRRLLSERERLTTILQQVQYSWLAISGVAYILGLSTCAIFWWWSIRDQGDRPGFLTTCTAYFAGHLGKYVPGKGLVVVIRAAMLRDAHVSLVTGTISCAHETLLMMATGALVATVLLPQFGHGTGGYTLVTAVAMLGGLGIPATPPGVSIWSRLIARPFQKGLPSDASYRCRWPTVGWGILVISVGWFLMGVSLAAVLQSMQIWSILADSMGVLSTLGFLTAIVAVATVIGFLSFLPGGLGSREWILVGALGPALGARAVDATVAALLLRVVWIVAEMIGTGVFWLLDRSWNNRQGVSD